MALDGATTIVVYDEIRFDPGGNTREITRNLVEESPMVILDGVDYIEMSPVEFDRPRVPDLTTHFGIEGCVVENEIRGIFCFDDIDELCFVGQRVKSKEGRGFGIAIRIGDKYIGLFLGCASSIALFLHFDIKCLSIYVNAFLFGNCLLNWVIRLDIFSENLKHMIVIVTVNIVQSAKHAMNNQR